MSEDTTMVTTTLGGMRRPCALLCFVATTGAAALVRADGAAPDLKPLVEAIASHGCSQDSHYRSVGGVPCDKIGRGGDPDAAIQALGGKTKGIVQALSLQTRSEDAACANNIGGVLATTHVGAQSVDELAKALVSSAVKDAMGPAGPLAVPAGMVLSIPGLTQVQYDYKGLIHGPEVRTFKITGRVEGDVDAAKLRLKMDGDVEGDKKLYVQYEVNYQKTKQSFPTWSPFLDAPGDIKRAFVRQGLNTLSDTADFSETGQHRNGVKVWHDYHYAWHAEKVGALPTDVVKLGADAIDDAATHPFGGDWVGTGWGVETRFKSSRKQFVAQFSPKLAADLSGAAADAVMMSLNVKHQVIFRFHVDYDGNVTGRGVIVYALDPDLCGVAVLTRQVNEKVNLMKYLPVVFVAAGQLAKVASARFENTWTSQPGMITKKMDEFIAKLPPKIEASAGSRDAAAFIARFAELKGKHAAFADVQVNVPGFEKVRLWGVAGKKGYPAIKEIVPLPKVRKFIARTWAKTFELARGGWDKTMLSKQPYLREFDSEDLLFEYLAEKIPKGASGIIKVYSQRPFCPSCTGVIEQAYWYFENITILVTSGG